MGDGEFWEHVLLGGPALEVDVDVEDLAGLVGVACTVCGTSAGPCGFDPDGLPFVHVDESA